MLCWIVPFPIIINCTSMTIENRCLQNHRFERLNNTCHVLHSKKSGYADRMGSRSIDLGFHYLDTQPSESEIYWMLIDYTTTAE